MTDKENESSNFVDLRSKAKDFLKKREIDLSSYPAEVSELIEDLNDNLGHASGDHILITIAGILKENLRDSDIIARIGGDEFAVHLPEIDQAGMQSIVERVRDSVEQFNSIQGQTPLSVSMGQAVSAQGNPDMAALFREADNRMYGEKMQRRESAHRSRA